MLACTPLRPRPRGQRERRSRASIRSPARRSGRRASSPDTEAAARCGTSRAAQSLLPDPPARFASFARGCRWPAPQALRASRGTVSLRMASFPCSHSFGDFLSCEFDPVAQAHDNQPFIAIGAQGDNWCCDSPVPAARSAVVPQSVDPCWIVDVSLGLLQPLVQIAYVFATFALDAERRNVNVISRVPRLPQLALDHLAESIGEDAAQFALAAGALRALRLAHAALGATARSNSRQRQFWHASICFVVRDRGTSSLLQPLQRGVGMGTHAGIGIGLRSSDMLFLAPGLRQLCTHKRRGEILRVVLDAVRSE